MNLQDISKLFVSKSGFMDNHFTNCKGGGGAISIAVGFVKQFLMMMMMMMMMMMCKSVPNAMQLTIALNSGGEIEQMY